jgi:type I restriction enzyme, S subunit
LSELESLPKGWLSYQLEELSDVIMGQAPTGESYNESGKGTLFVKVGEFGNLFPNKVVWTTKPLKFAKPNDVLICVVGATIGKLNLGIDCAIGRSVSAIRSNKLILFQKFLYYFLKPKIMKIRNEQQGSAQGVISKKYLEKMIILLPPLNEQKRIVSKIEELFSELDNVKGTLQNVKLQLVQYRQSLLKSLFENKDWDYVRFGDFLTLEYGKGLSKKDRKEGNIPVFGSAGIGGYHNKALVENSSLVIGRKGNAGNVLLVEQAFWAIDTTYFLKETKDYNLKFLYHLFKFLNFGKLDSSTTIPSLRRDDVYAQSIPLPEMEKQNDIVSQIEQGFSLIENTENIANTMLKQLETLRSSILKQAFEGKLVPQDPNDEPVEKLLQRIKKQQTKTKSRGKK